MSVDIQPSINPGKHKLYQNLPLDGQDLKTLIEASLIWLKTNQQTVNALNVYPIPDGDTGTNMVLTMQAAFNEITASGERNIGKMAHAIARGALMGARGNSGVILSQLWRGFARALDNLETMDSLTFVRALGEAKITAYKGVVRPVEGTILTVAKDVAQSTETVFKDKKEILDILETAVQAADESVKRTPDLLPVLKSAGVVDAGGKGLFYILEGMLRYAKEMSLETPVTTVQPLSSLVLDNSLEEIEPGQDYEIVVDFRPNQPFDLDNFYANLSAMGTSIQVGEGEGIYRMHIHVADDRLNEPIEYIRSVGTLVKSATENLRVQVEAQAKGTNQKIQLTPVEGGQIAVVAVAPGSGIAGIFASLGAAGIIEGGQTMNPSTEDILRSFEHLPTDKIIILPNNKNIILAAESAVGLTDKRVVVIPSKSIPQGLSAILRMAPEGDLEKVCKEMKRALTEVETGEITTATRSVELNSVQVREGEVIALYNGELVFSSTSVEDACKGLLERANLDNHERITLFYGAGFDKPDVDHLAEQIQAQYAEMEIEVHEGGQPHYQLIISIE